MDRYRAVCDQEQARVDQMAAEMKGLVTERRQRTGHAPNTPSDDTTSTNGFITEPCNATDGEAEEAPSRRSTDVPRSGLDILTSSFSPNPGTPTLNERRRARSLSPPVDRPATALPNQQHPFIPLFVPPAPLGRFRSFSTEPEHLPDGPANQDPNTSFQSRPPVPRLSSKRRPKERTQIPDADPNDENIGEWLASHKHHPRDTVVIDDLKRELERNERLKVMLYDIENQEPVQQTASRQSKGLPLRANSPFSPERSERRPSELSWLAVETSKLKLASPPKRKENTSPEAERNCKLLQPRYIRASTPMPGSGAVVQDVVEDRVKPSVVWSPLRTMSEEPHSPESAPTSPSAHSSPALFMSQSGHGASTYVSTRAFRRSFSGDDSYGEPLRLVGQARDPAAAGVSPVYQELKYARPGGLSEPLTGEILRDIELAERDKHLMSLEIQEDNTESRSSEEEMPLSPRRKRKKPRKRSWGSKRSGSRASKSSDE